MLVVAVVTYMVASLIYIRSLHRKLKAYEHIWNQIEGIADNNQDGTFTLDVRHLEDVHPNNEAHTSINEYSEPLSSGVVLSTDEKRAA